MKDNEKLQTADGECGQVGGTTLHSFAGIGAGTASVAACVDLASRKTVAAQWKRCRHLIIDEISMVDGNYFKKLEHVARQVQRLLSYLYTALVFREFETCRSVLSGEEQRQAVRWDPADPHWRLPAVAAGYKGRPGEKVRFRDLGLAALRPGQHRADPGQAPVRPGRKILAMGLPL